MIRYGKLTASLAVAVAVLWGTAAVCLAHHLWTQETDNGFMVCRGAIGKRLDPYSPARVTHITAKDASGADIPLNRTDEENRVTFTAQGQPILVETICKWGDRVNTTRGKKLMGRQEAEKAGFTVVSAFQSTQYAKTLLAPSDLNCRPLGLRFEIVPLADPAASPPGTRLSFRLLFDGQPLAGATIFTNLKQEATTDAEGEVTLSFKGSGMHLLYANHKVPADEDSGVDYQKHMTFLTFGTQQ